MDFLDIAKYELKFQKHMLKQFNVLRRIKDSGVLICEKRKSGYVSYYIKEPKTGRKHYVKKRDPKDAARLRKLKIKGFSSFAAERAENNIDLLNQLISGYKKCDISSLLSEVPDPFRLPDPFSADACHYSYKGKGSFPQSENPYRREELKHSTSFGLFTRSKNEALTAERLYAQGIEFYYEKELVLIDEKGKRKTVYPDFTIILADGTVIYWEHKGMMNNHEYAQRDNVKMRLYYLNGIYQPENLIVTADGPNGEYSGVKIGLIIDFLLAPISASRF